MGRAKIAITVDEHALIQSVEREAVTGAETVVRRRELDLHDLAALHANLGRLVLPGVLAQLNHAIRCADEVT